MLSAFVRECTSWQCSPIFMLNQPFRSLFVQTQTIQNTVQGLTIMKCNQPSLQKVMSKDDTVVSKQVGSVFGLWSWESHDNLHHMKAKYQRIQNKCGCQFPQVFVHIEPFQFYTGKVILPTDQTLLHLYSPRNLTLLAIIGKQVWMGCECESLNGLL